MKQNNEVQVGRILELKFLTKSKAKIETNNGSFWGWSFEGKLQELQTNAFSFISDSLISLRLSMLYSFQLTMFLDNHLIFSCELN